MEKNKDISEIFCIWEAYNIKIRIMKIVYCLPSTYNMGGIERIISGKANMFSKIGYDVS